MVIVAIIPARGGSKRIPRKCIRTFHGKPIISYSIKAASESGLFDHVIVSTDDEEIAQVAKDCGAEVPFMRPRDLADDFTGTNAVVDHALQELKKCMVVDYACCIYATAPFLELGYLKNGYHKLTSERKQFVFSATHFPFPIKRGIYLRNGKLAPVDKIGFSSRSQDLEDAYHDAGQFYWGTPAGFSSDYDFLSEETGIVLLPKHTVCDIDTEDDFMRAEKMFHALKKEENASTS